MSAATGCSLTLNRAIWNIAREEFETMLQERFENIRRPPIGFAVPEGVKMVTVDLLQPLYDQNQ